MEKLTARAQARAVLLLAPPVDVLRFNVPTNSVLGPSSAGGLAPSRPAQEAEVEDYLVILRQRASTTKIIISSITATCGGTNQIVSLNRNAQTNVH